MGGNLACDLVMTALNDQIFASEQAMSWLVHWWYAHDPIRLDIPSIAL
jgi:hypothetical protein